MMQKLPEDFSDLERLVTTWALPTENARSQKRWASNPADFQDLYDAMIERIGDVLDYLDETGFDNYDDKSCTLCHLALAFAEASPHVEMYKGSSEVPNSFDAERFVAAHGDIADCPHQ
jgi:hypothetical protein